MRLLSAFKGNYKNRKATLPRTVTSTLHMATRLIALNPRILETRPNGWFVLPDYTVALSLVQQVLKVWIFLGILNVPF